MSEIKFAFEPTAQPEESAPAADARTSDITLLSDLELALAGGGDTVITWP